jgi:spore germination protein YaaH
LFQGALVTLISLALYFSSLLGGVVPSIPRQVDPPSSQITESTPDTGRGVVTGHVVVVYDAIGSRQSVAELQRGDYVEILKREGSWYQVRLSSGKVGYVTAFTVMPASDAAPVKGVERQSPYTVLGYYVSDARLPSFPSLRTNDSVLTAISPWTWEVTPAGTLVASFDTRDTAAALKHAGEQGLRTYALIHNMALDAKGRGNFNSTLAHQLLANPTARKRLVYNILQVLKDWRMSGVHVDFEMVQPSDRHHLNAFMQELHEILHPAGFEITMALPSKTRELPNDSWSGAFDYAVLSRYTDQMMLMTYDEHWSGGSPGPVASIAWVEDVIRYALSTGVPRHKIILGIAGYGYDWPAHGKGRAVTYQGALNIANQYKVPVLWDSKAKVPHIRYGDGRQIWFENRQSLSYKLELVNRYQLGGISVWRLGQEDPGCWAVIRDMLG